MSNFENALSFAIVAFLNWFIFECSIGLLRVWTGKSFFRSYE